MQTLRLQMIGDGGINVMFERQVADDVAITLFRKAKDAISTDAAKPRGGRKAPGGAADDAPTPDVSAESES
jgi:hypothetical protein